MPPRQSTNPNNLQTWKSDCFRQASRFFPARHVQPVPFTVPWSIPPSGVARESSGPGGPLSYVTSCCFLGKAAPRWWSLVRVLEPCIRVFAVYRRVSAANSVYPRSFACFRCTGARPVYVQSVVDVRHPQLICRVPEFTARGPMRVLVCYGQKRRILLDRLHASGVTQPA